MDEGVQADGPHVVGYVRVSTQEQAHGGVSLAAQEAALERYATACGLKLVETVSDAGVSAGVPLGKRPGGARLFEAIAGGHAQGVVALKLDRLFRDAIDALEVTRNWDRSGVTLHLVDMHIDTASAMGRLFLTMMAALAEMERNLIGERTAAALAQVKAEGGRIGPEGFGWRRRDERDETGRLVVEPVEEQLEAARRMVALREAGSTYQEIADQITADGWPTKRGGRWFPGTVRRVILRYRDQRLARVA